MRCWSERWVLVWKVWISVCLRLGPRLGRQGRTLRLLVQFLVLVDEGRALLVELLELVLRQLLVVIQLGVLLFGLPVAVVELRHVNDEDFGRRLGMADKGGGTEERQR